jgi:transposase InsO family protein
VRTREGWLYLSFVLDTYPRRIVGWSMANHLRTELVLDALNMAIYNRRRAAGLIHHSDRGSQYASVEFGSRLREGRLLPSMGSVADAYDDSMAESFVSTLKRESIHRHSWPNRQSARTAIFEYVEGFYNTRGRHSALGHLSPAEYEEARMRGLLHRRPTRRIALLSSPRREQGGLYIVDQAVALGHASVSDELVRS